MFPKIFKNNALFWKGSASIHCLIALELYSYNSRSFMFLKQNIVQLDVVFMAQRHFHVSHDPVTPGAQAALHERCFKENPRMLSRQLPSFKKKLRKWQALHSSSLFPAVSKKSNGWICLTQNKNHQASQNSHQWRSQVRWGWDELPSKLNQSHLNTKKQIFNLEVLCQFWGFLRTKTPK